MTTITIETLVKAPIRSVWESWTTPADITHWNFASDDWHCPQAEIDLIIGGAFNYRMEAKDQSGSFDFAGTFTAVRPYSSLHFELNDGRSVKVEFTETNGSVRVVESFEAENIHSIEQQKEGWQSILNNFKKHVETKQH